MRIPKYRKHGSRDYAIVEYKGERVNLPGLFNSAESKAAYKAFLSRCVFGAPQPPERNPDQFTITQLAAAYLDFARLRYPPRDEADTTEYDNCRQALRPLVDLFGAERAADFGPLKLKRLQQHMGGKRSYVNSRVGRIKRAFKWAVSEELIPPSVFQGIATVQGLQSDTEKKAWVPWSSVEVVLPFLSPPVRAMILVQWHTGCRSQSICLATVDQFTLGDDLWEWRPRHKQEHTGAELVLPIGPLCQRVLGPLMDRKPGEYLFSPRSVGSSQRYRKHYTSGTYYTAVRDAVAKAKVEPWTPHQLRHSKGHAIREKYGIEAAQSILGHDSLDATKIYSARRVELARQVARETG